MNTRFNEKIYKHIVSVLFLVLAPLLVVYFHLNEREFLMENFYKNEILVCNIYNQDIKVSKDKSWQIKEFNFVNDDLQIPVTKCKLKD